MVYSELTEDERRTMARMRQLVSEVAGAIGKRWPPEGVDEGLGLLQALIDEEAFSKPIGLTAYGVCFGDLHCMAGPLRWTHQESEVACGAYVRWKETSIGINATYMIRKRIEAGQPVDIRDVFKNQLEQCQEIEDNGAQ